MPPGITIEITLTGQLGQLMYYSRKRIFPDWRIFENERLGVESITITRNIKNMYLDLHYFLSLSDDLIKAIESPKLFDKIEISYTNIEEEDVNVHREDMFTREEAIAFYHKYFQDECN